MKYLSLLFVPMLIACSEQASDVPAPDLGAQDSPPVSGQEVNLSPDQWPEDELAGYINASGGATMPEALPSLKVNNSGYKGIVASTWGGLAVHAGVQALKQGGTAADAILTTALTQIVLHMGGATSYAGHSGMYYYEASSGKVYNLNSSYATVLGELDPMTIPAYGTPSGRAVLVPGFMAGVEAAHQKFGRLPFSQLFQPAIYLAEKGIKVSPLWARLLEQREHVLKRRPEGRKIFLNDKGMIPQAGDTFYQPELAGFLHHVAEEGIGYMYEGAWAQKFVDVVQEEGGKMALEDLRQYKPVWSTPSPADFRGYQVYAGEGLQERLQLVELANLRQFGHYTESPEALYWLIKISRASTVIGPTVDNTELSPNAVQSIFPEIDVSEANRYSAENSARIWAAMQTPRWAELEALSDIEELKRADEIARLIKDFRVRPRDEEKTEEQAAQEEREKTEGARPDHTSGIVVVDSEGNMASMVHSVTSAVWGELGIFVEGVSVTDPAGFRQAGVAAAGPGKVMGADKKGGDACAAIVVKDSRPYLGCGNVGASYDLVALQGLVNMMEYGMDTTAVEKQPMFRKNWPPGQPVRQPVGEGEFSREILQAVKAMGIDIEPEEDSNKVSQGGGWVVVAVGEDGLLTGTKTSGRHSEISASDLGQVEAY